MRLYVHQITYLLIEPVVLLLFLNIVGKEDFCFSVMEANIWLFLRKCVSVWLSSDISGLLL